MYTVKELADRYQVSAKRVNIWVQTGELRAVNVSRNPNSKKPNLRFREADVEEFENRRTTGTQSVSKPRRVSTLGKDWAARAEKLGLKIGSLQ